MWRAWFVIPVVVLDVFIKTDKLLLFFVSQSWWEKFNWYLCLEILKLSVGNHTTPKLTPRVSNQICKYLGLLSDWSAYRQACLRVRLYWSQNRHNTANQHLSGYTLQERVATFNPLNPELNPICYLLALLAHHFLHVNRVRVKSLTLRLLMSYIYIYIYIYIWSAYFWCF